MKELIDLVAACPTNLKCCDFHHAKEDQHGHGEVCKPMDRYYAALEQAQHHIEERRKKEMAKEMGDNIKLPPSHYDELPEHDDAIPAMRAYARKAIKADRQLRGETVDEKGFQSEPKELARLMPEELASLKSSGEDVSVGYPVKPEQIVLNLEKKNDH